MKDGWIICHTVTYMLGRAGQGRGQGSMSYHMIYILSLRLTRCCAVPCAPCLPRAITMPDNLKAIGQVGHPACLHARGWCIIALYVSIFIYDDMMAQSDLRLLYND
jgi:hypothetical protein